MFNPSTAKETNVWTVILIKGYKLPVELSVTRNQRKVFPVPPISVYDATALTIWILISSTINELLVCILLKETYTVSEHAT